LNSPSCTVADVRFEAHNGLKSDIAPFLKSAKSCHVKQGPDFQILEAEFAVLARRVEELQRAIAFRSWRMIGRAAARRATSLKPACANAETVPVKMFDVLFGAVVSTG
jgi:hypothetical protein